MGRRSKNRWGTPVEVSTQEEKPVVETQQVEIPTQEEIPVSEAPKPQGKQTGFSEEDIRLGKIIR